MVLDRKLVILAPGAQPARDFVLCSSLRVRVVTILVRNANAPEALGQPVRWHHALHCARQRDVFVWVSGGPLLERCRVRVGANVSVGLWLRHGDEWAPGRVVVHLLHLTIVSASALLQPRKRFRSQMHAKLLPWNNSRVVL